MSGSILIPVMIFLPMLFGGAAYFAEKASDKLRDTLARLGGFAELALAISGLVLTMLCGASGMSFRLCGMELTFRMDGFRAVYSLIAAFMWSLTLLFSPGYFAHYGHKNRYYLFNLLTLGATVGVFLSDDLYATFIFFEIMSFASYPWVAHEETKGAMRAAQTYLAVAVLGGMVTLMGMFILWRDAGTLSFEGLREYAEQVGASSLYLPGVLVFFGFAAKAGVFPLHIWLPKAHPVAPAPASALLSGILTKSGIFGVIAITCWLFDGVASWGNILLVPAVITMVLGAVMAVFSVDLKRTLACSSMSQIGFILTGISMCALLGEHGGIAAYGTVLHVLNHSLIKLTLFVAAGVVYFNVHSLNLNDVRGFGRGKPLLMLAFLSGACSIAGIPGFGGYISKTLLHESIVEYAELLAEQGLNAAPYHAAEWLFLLSGGLTLAYMTRLFYILFIAKKPEHQHQKEGRYMQAPTAAVLAIGGILMPLLGLTAHNSMDKIAEYAAEFFRRHPMEHAVNYFSLANLKGAAISITIGVIVFLLVGMKWLTAKKDGEEVYRNVWPKKLDLEDSVYRPFLRGLSFAGGAVARLVESVGALLIYGTVDLIFLGAEKKVIPPEDEHFSGYTKNRERSSMERSFSSDLLCAALGVSVILILVLFNI